MTPIQITTKKTGQILQNYHAHLHQVLIPKKKMVYCILTSIVLTVSRRPSPWVSKAVLTLLRHRTP